MDNTMATKEKIIIWMQNGTPKGIIAAKLAVAYGHEYEIKNISNDYSWKELDIAVPNNHHKVPQIFLGEKLLGGLDAMITELKIDTKNLI
jgi:glutaredoxin